MIQGTIRAVNSRPHRTKEGFKEYGLLVNDNWYNLVVPEFKDKVGLFEKGKKIEFELLEGNTKYINGRSVKYNKLNASNDNTPVPSTYLHGGVTKASDSPVTISYTGDIDKSLAPVIAKIDNLFNFIKAFDAKIESVSRKIDQLNLAAQKPDSDDLGLSDLEEPPFDMEF